MKRAGIILLLIAGVQMSVAGQPECIVPPEPGSDAIVILRVEYAATHPNDEFIVIINEGNSPVDLSGWVVFNSYYEAYRNLPMPQRTDKMAWRHIYKIPSGFILEPKFWVRISSGFGDDSEMYLYRNLYEGWLEDGGDTVYLMDNYCNVIQVYSWP